MLSLLLLIFEFFLLLGLADHSHTLGVSIATSPPQQHRQLYQEQLFYPRQHHRRHRSSSSSDYDDDDNAATAQQPLLPPVRLARRERIHTSKENGFPEEPVQTVGNNVFETGKLGNTRINAAKAGAKEAAYMAQLDGTDAAVAYGASAAGAAVGADG
ncbi:hypothetical protein DFJ73DRAFT_756846 [Zopfochytrium polystomum]|nr:hypothetical protein DFJ73DRAFT_756846 [Zopfochytrium polystomum]